MANEDQEDKRTREECMADLLVTMTPLQQRVVVHRGRGLATADCYRLACMDNQIEPGKWPAQSGAQILRVAKVAEYIQLLERPFGMGIVQDQVMGIDEMKRRLTVLARGTSRELVDVVTKLDDDGRPMFTDARMLDTSDLSVEKASLVKEIKLTRQGIAVVLHSSTDAMKQLAALQGYDAAIKSDVTLSDRPARPVIPIGPALDKLAALDGDTPEGTA